MGKILRTASIFMYHTSLSLLPAQSTLHNWPQHECVPTTHNILPNDSLPSVLLCLLDDLLALLHLLAPVCITHPHLLQPLPSLIFLLLPEALGCCCLLGKMAMKGSSAEAHLQFDGVQDEGVPWDKVHPCINADHESTNFSKPH